MKRSISIFILLLIGFLVGRYASPIYQYADNVITNLSTKIHTTFASEPEVPFLQLSIETEMLEKLTKQKTEAIKRGILLKSSEDYIDASISFCNQIYPIQLRLKGDWADHLNTDKWSMRIKSEIPILGMKKFSLQHPATRNYLSEWLFHQALKQEGFIALQYFFVKVSINGDDHGIYALEEFFDDELLKRNGCISAPILKFNEDNLWKEMAQYIDSGISKEGLYDQLLFQTINTATIDAFNLDNIIRDSLLKEQFTIGKNRLQAFLDTTLPASTIFDPEMPRFIALCEALGAEHALLWHNLRFYFNPQTNYLEPIGFDAMLDSCPTKANGSYFISNYHSDTFLRLLLTDSSFTKKYMYWLNYYSQPLFLNNLQEKWNDSIQKNLTILHTEWPSTTLPTDLWEEKRKLIQLSLHPPSAFYAYLKDATHTQLSIEIDNISGLPVEILGLVTNDSIDVSPSNKKILLRYPQRNTITFNLPTDTIYNSAHLKLKFRTFGLTTIKTEKVIPYARR